MTFGKLTPEGMSQRRILGEARATTHGNTIPMTTKPFHPFILLDVPDTDSAVLPTTGKVSPIRTQGQGPYFIRVALQVSQWVRKGFTLALSIYFWRSHFVEGMRFATCMEVPLDNGTIF